MINLLDCIHLFEELINNSPIKNFFIEYENENDYFLQFSALHMIKKFFQIALSHIINRKKFAIKVAIKNYYILEASTDAFYIKVMRFAGFLRVQIHS